MVEHTVEKKVKAIQTITAGDSIGRVANKNEIDRRDMSYLWRLHEELGLGVIPNLKAH